MEYGKSAPKSAIGKLIIKAWMVNSMILTTSFTSTMTNAFHFLDQLDIHQKHVAALDGSLEAWVSNKDYLAKIDDVPDYDLLFGGIAEKKYTIGVIDSHVLRYKQSQLGDIRAVKKLSSQIPVPWIHFDYGYDSIVHHLDVCIWNLWYSGVETISHRYELLQRKKLDRKYHFIDYFSEPFVFILSILTGACIVGCLLTGAAVLFRKCMQSDSSYDVDIEQPRRNGLEKLCNRDKNGGDLRDLKNIASKDDVSELKRQLNAKIDQLQEHIDKSISKIRT